MRAQVRLYARQARNLLGGVTTFFKELADFASVMIWQSLSPCDWFNKPWLDFVGRTMEQELGNSWAEGVHTDDFDRCLSIYSSSLMPVRHSA